MSFTNITDEELVGKGVTGLPDTPGLSTEDMQAQFDEYSVFLKDKFKTLISELEAVSGALNIGAVVPDNITADGNIQSILNGLRQYVDDTVIAIGTGDMATGIYDPDRDGVIAPAQGGTGQTSLQDVRNAMGLGNTLEALPIANGGTGQTTAAGIRSVLGLGSTTGALPIANGGTGASTVKDARNALGLGNTSGALPIENGGTGASTAAAARNALGLGNTTGALPVANGGTGKTSITSGTVLVGNGQSTPTERSIDTTSGGTADSNALITSGAVKSKITEMQATFQDGVDTIVDAIERNGVTPSASTPSACADGIDDVYTKGKTDAESVIWEQTLNIRAVLLASSNAPMQFGTILNCDNMIKLKMTQCVSAVSGVTWEFLNASNGLISNGAFSLNTDVQVPSNAVKLSITASKEGTSSVNNNVVFTVTNQAKLIHS